VVHKLTQKLWIRRVPISIPKTIFIQNLLRNSESISSCVTATVIPTLPIHYKLQNAQWIEEVHCEQKNPVFFFKCELHVKVKLYRAANSVILTHFSSQMRTILFRAIGLISVPLHKNISVGMLNYKRKNEISLLWFRASYINKWKHQLDATFLSVLFHRNRPLYILHVSGVTSTHHQDLQTCTIRYDITLSL